MSIVHVLITTMLFLGFAPPKGEIVFNNLTLEKSINKISKLADLNIIVRWSVLEAAAIEKDTEINLKVHGISYRKILELVLDDAGGGDVELGYVIEDGIIIVSTKEDLSRKTKTKVYNIKDLLILIPKFLGRLNLDSIGQGSGQEGGLGGGRFLRGGGGGSGGGSGGGGSGGGGTEAETVDTTLQQLMDLIRKTIDPESWREAGGNVGAINSFQDQLIITQTQTAHKQIRDL